MHPHWQNHRRNAIFATLTGPILPGWIEIDDDCGRKGTGSEPISEPWRERRSMPESLDQDTAWSASLSSIRDLESGILARSSVRWIVSLFWRLGERRWGRR